MVLWKYTVREVRSRPGRAMLTLLSIVISVSAVVAVSIGKSTTQEACKAMYESMAGRAALEIDAEDSRYFSDGLVDQVAKIPGVQSAMPLVVARSLFHFSDSKPLMVPVKGIDHRRAKEALYNYDLPEENVFHDDAYGVVIEAGFAQAMKLHVGDEINMHLGRMVKGSNGNKLIQTLTVQSILTPKGVGGLEQAGGVIYLPLSTAEVFFSKVDNAFVSKVGYINRISLTLAENADEKVVAAEITKILPPGLLSHPPIMRAQLSKETLQSVELGLTFACVTMVGVALVMIVNTFLMNVGERRRQLAVLRAIGTTRRQLVRAMLFEGAAMGLVGTLVGSLLGLGGAYLLTQAMGRVYGTEMPSLRITLGPFLLALVLGPSISIIAMFAPAFIATKISPLEGMRFVVRENQGRITLRYILSTILIFAVTGGLLAACVTGYLPIQGAVYVGVLFTLAFLAFVPIILQPLSQLACFVLYPLLRIEGRIAQRQVLRRRMRTSLTIGVLYVAVSTIISVGTTILNNVDDIHSWQAKTFKGEYIVRGFSSVDSSANTSGVFPPIPESLKNDFSAVEGVTGVDTLSMVPVTIPLSDASASGSNASDSDSKENLEINVVVRDLTGAGDLPMDIKSGDVSTIKKQLADGQVIMGSIVANKAKKQVGDEVTLMTGKGPVRVRIAATTSVYLNGGKIVYMDEKIAKELLHIEGVNTFIIHVAPKSIAEAYDKLKAICSENSVMLLSFAELRQRVDKLINGVIASLWGVLALGFVVGAFGIANTLTMNVLEQTRELALLRVVAMTRWQVRKTILAQAVIIGFIGLTLGVAGGVIGSFTSNFCSGRMLGNPVAFAFQPELLVISFGLGMFVVLLAALLPAERAARLNLLIALQYE
jgi:putative ABC transport system permease protein